MLNSIPQQRSELVQTIQTSAKLSAVFQALTARESDGDAAHDLAHLLRVALWTGKILADPGQIEHAIAAALLHDLVNVPKNHPNRTKASELSATAARPILRRVGFEATAEDKIAVAIRQHSFSRGERPESELAKALQDADRLEALGSIGIMRTYSTGVRMGTQYFNPSDPWAHERSLDDRQFSLDHFFVKLLKLPESMNTAAGRQEALERVKPMEAFLTSLERELGVARGCI
jgi:uncharacterized protein